MKQLAVCLLLITLLGVAFGQTATPMTIGSTESGTIIDDDSWQYYVFTMPVDNPNYAVRVTLTFTSGYLGLFARTTDVPTMDQSDFATTTAVSGQNSMQLVIPACVGTSNGEDTAEWFVGVYSSTGEVTFSVTLTAVTTTFSALSAGSSVTGSVSQFGWRFYTVNIPANNSFISAVLTQTAGPSHGTALFIRPMACPTLRQSLRSSSDASVQTVTASCTETMEGEWFVAVGSNSNTAGSYSLQLHAGPYESINSGQTITSNVALAGWRNYRMTVPKASTLRLELTTPGAFRQLKVYMNSGQCGNTEQSQLVGGFESSSTSTSPSSVTQLFPVAADDWYLGVTGDCTPQSTCAYTLRMSAEQIECRVPQLTFCHDVTWSVGNYTALAAADTAAQSAYQATVSSLSAPPSTTCDYVIRMLRCASQLPACDSSGLPLLPCRRLCLAYNQCTGATLPCQDTTQFGAGVLCTAPPGYSAAGTLAASWFTIILLVAMAGMAVL